jgi:hypothetical protein
VNTPHTLDRFEAALLDELRAHVATRPAVTPPTQQLPRPSRRRRWAGGLAAAAAAATAYVIVSPGGPAVSPAYGIDETPDGDVVVTIHRLDDADGLERALRDHGIDAEVSFDPTSNDSFELEGPGVVEPDEAAPAPGERGTLERRTEAGGDGPRLDRSGKSPEGEAGPDDELDPGGCGTGEPATLAQEGDDWVLRIPADSPLQDRPVEITTSPDGGLSAAYAGDEPGSYCAVMSVAG